MPMVDAKGRPFLINQQISNMFNTGHPQILKESMVHLANLMVQSADSPVDHPKDQRTGTGFSYVSTILLIWF